jgi:hypothetical protein
LLRESGVVVHSFLLWCLLYLVVMIHDVCHDVQVLMAVVASSMTLC